MTNEIQLLDHGFVALVDTMGTDRTPAQTARTSYRNRKERTPEEDAKLTDYLVRNRHTTPLEFVQLLFYMKLPIFVARQLVRHRTASINEVSYRYVQAQREFYVPALDRMQRKSESNKQGSSNDIVDAPSACANGAGYCCSIDEAGQYTGKDARALRGTDVPWPVEYVLQHVVRHVRVDTQAFSRKNYKPGSR